MSLQKRVKTMSSDLKPFSKRTRQIKLGLMFQASGHHIASWLLPETDADCALDFKKYTSLAKTAERGLFDLIFEADSLSGERFTADTLPRTALGMRIEPMTCLTALAAVTEEIGLVCTATTTYDQPYFIARRFASLDLISGGRSGWNVVTSANASEGRNFGIEEQLPKAERYRRAREFVEVVRGLWGSWDEGSLLIDRERGLFYDPNGLHVLDHVGDFFSVRGPLTTYRSPQGEPLIVQAGASDEGRQLAAETADLVFAAHQSIESAREFYSDIKTRAEAVGRNPKHVLIMPGFGVMVAKSRQEALDNFAELQNLISPEVGVALLSRYLVWDLQDYDVDGPIPELPAGRNVPTRSAMLASTARAEGLSIRQLYQRIAGGRGHFQVIGSIADVADKMEEWFHDGAADGFNIIPQVFPSSLNEFVDLVVPELQRRGIFRTKYEGKTLREKLELPIPRKVSLRHRR